MIHYFDSTVFNINAQTLVNTVNCVGVMGAGLALEFRLRYPEMFKNYVVRCNSKEIRIGRPGLYRKYGNPWIMNFPTKNHWKYPSKLEWIQQGLMYIAANYEKAGITSIAFPKLGSSHGGLDWQNVKSLMEQCLRTLKLDIYICLDREPKAQGIEKKMLEFLNNSLETQYINELNLRKNIRSHIIDALPVNRFHHLLRIQGIGKQSYERLFTFFYSKALSTQYEIVSTKTLFPLDQKPLELIYDKERRSELEKRV